MKRYDIIPKKGRGGILFVKAVETPEGEYVRYIDLLKKETAKMNFKTENLTEDQLMTLKLLVDVEVEKRGLTL